MKGNDGVEYGYVVNILAVMVLFGDGIAVFLGNSVFDLNGLFGDNESPVVKADPYADAAIARSKSRRNAAQKHCRSEDHGNDRRRAFSY